MKKYLFAKPNHMLQSGIPIIPGIVSMIASFFFRGDGATNSQIGFFAMGLGLVLIGCAEFLPQSSSTAAGVFRILAVVGIFVGFLMLILLWTGISL